MIVFDRFAEMSVPLHDQLIISILVQLSDFLVDQLVRRVSSASKNTDCMSEPPAIFVLAVFRPDAIDQAQAACRVSGNGLPRVIVSEMNWHAIIALWIQLVKVLHDDSSSRKFRKHTVCEMNKRTNERSNKRSNDRTIERSNERTNEQTKEQKNDRTIERSNKRTNDRTKERTIEQERTNDQAIN